MTSPRVLVIEDEALVGLDIVTALETAGFGPVEYAATEKEALQQLHSKQWDAVVADANLNGRSIEPVVQTLRERHIPFVIVTGYDRENLPQAIREAPVVSKPFSAAPLVQAVRRLFAGA